MTRIDHQSRSSRFSPELLPKRDASDDVLMSRPGPRSLAGVIRRGALWSAAGTIIFRISNVLVMAMVARILAPDEFGVFALAVTVHAFIISLAELGVAAAIARADLNVSRIAPTVASISVGMSLLLALLMAVSAQPLALLLGSDEATGSIRILAIGVALIGPFAVPGALLQREMKQSRIFTASVCGFIPGSAFLIWSSLSGGGVEGLAWSRVLTQLITGIVMVISCGKFYRPGLDLSVLAPLLGFGIPLALSNLLSQVLLNIDNVFVGNLLGVAELGTYSIAFAVSSWSNAVVGTMLNALVLPGITHVLRDNGNLEEAVTTATRLLAWVAAPIAAFSTVFAEPLVLTVYGPKWAGASPVLSVLAAYGFVFVLGLLFANVIIATGRTMILLWVQVAAMLVLLPSLPIGIQLGGTAGAAWAHVLVVSLVTLPVYLTSLRRASGIQLSKLVKQIARPVLAAGGSAGGAWLVAAPIEASPLRLGVGFMVFGAIYLLTSQVPPNLVPERLFPSKSAERR